MNKNIEKIIHAINKKYGEGTIVVGGYDNIAIERVSSGIVALDLALGLGIPRSSIIMFYGRESSAKSSIALKIISEYQKRGELCAYIDIEHSLSADWAEKLGVNLNDLVIAQPDSLEKSIDITDSLTRSGEFGLIVYDSLAMAVPEEELEKSAFDQQMALQARLFSKAMRKLMSALQPKDLSDKSTYNKTTVLLINQVREDIGKPYAKGYTYSGGHALRHTARIIVEFARGDYIKDKNQEPIGLEVKFRTVKNKTWYPYRTGMIKLYFDGRIDNSETIIAEAKKIGIIKQHGAMYEYDNIKERGFDNFIKIILEKNLLDEILEKVYNYYKKGY